MRRTVIQGSFEPYFWAQFFHKSFDTITFFNSPYHTTTSPEYFQKFYIQKRQGIEIYHTPTVVAS